MKKQTKAGVLTGNKFDDVCIEFRRQHNSLVDYFTRYVFPKADSRHKEVITGSLEIMRVNRGFLCEVISREKVKIDNDTLDLIWKAVRYHMKSEDSALKYSPLRLFYILLSVYIVKHDAKLLSDKKFLNSFKTISHENVGFTCNNRHVISSLINLGARSTYYKRISDYIKVHYTDK